MYFSTCSSYADTVTPSIVWEKTFSEKGMFQPYAINQTDDGGSILLCQYSPWLSQSADQLIKLDSQGNVQWKTNVSYSRYQITGESLIQSSDDGYVIVGSTGYSMSQTRVFLIKTDSVGNILWNKTYGSNIVNLGKAVRQTSDGGYIITGGTGDEDNNSSVLLLKTDASGNEQWEKTFIKGNYDWGDSILPTKDGFIIGGRTTRFDNPSVYDGWHNESYGSYLGARDLDMEDIVDIYVIKTDNNGNEAWNKTFGTIGKDECSAILHTNDDGYMVVGDSRPSSDERDIYLIKIDSEGNTQWETHLSKKDYNLYCSSARETSDGGCIITGMTIKNYSFGEEAYVLKVDSNGSRQWDKIIQYENDERYNTDNTYYKVPRAIIQTNDGGYIIAGYQYFNSCVQTDGFIIKLGGTSPSVVQNINGAGICPGAILLSILTLSLYIKFDR